MSMEANRRSQRHSHSRIRHFEFRALWTIFGAIVPSETESRTELKLTRAESRTRDEKSGGTSDHAAGVDEVRAIREVEDFANQCHSRAATSNRNRIPQTQIEAAEIGILGAEHRSAGSAVPVVGRSVVTTVKRSPLM